MKQQSLVTQFRMTLVYIILSTLFVSMITYAAAAFLFVNALNKKSINPENHYEQQIPKVENYVHEEGAAVLSSRGQDKLKELVHGEGFFYQAADHSGNIMHGTYEEQIFDSQQKLYQRLNTTFHIKGFYVHVIPVIDHMGKINGAVSLVYKLNLPAVNNSSLWVSIASLFLISAPFFYMILFTILFSRNYAKKISHPLQVLADGSRQIKMKNLDFDIDYHAENELGELCTAFNEMKEELKQSLSAQWKLEQDRVEITEALAHDLKSPLSIIKAYSEALSDDTDVDEEQKQYLTVIEENIEKSVLLVNQMQYTSELESSGAGVVKGSVNLLEFLQRKIYDYDLQARRKNIKMILEIRNDEIPDTVITDVNKLERILDNILSNSLQYTPAGGKIRIFVKKHNQFVVYRISDTGMGFTSMDMEKAFERFYRGDEARQSQGGHSGLGLYIVKQLSELLGGSVKIENLSSGGACVSFSHSWQ